MPEGIPDELWTDYANFFWDNRTGLFFGAALFGLGFTTLILAGFVSLCRRGFGGTSGTMTVSKQPRRSIDNPLYSTNREDNTSREVLVRAAAAIDGHQSTAHVTDIEEPMEEPTVIYENEQFFNAAKRSKTSDVEEAVAGPSGDARNLQPKFAYSSVIKKSNERARKKKEGGETQDNEKRDKRKKRDVYSQVFKKENNKGKKTQKVESEDSPEASEGIKVEKAESSKSIPKHETEQVPEVPEKRFEDNETNKKTTYDENVKGVEEESRQKHNEGHEGQGDEGQSVEGQGIEGQGIDGQGSEDEGLEDYVNVSAPRILSIGDEEAYLDMSQKEGEHDPEDYVNCTNLKSPM